MSGNIQFTDETGATTLSSIDTSGQMDAGNGTPSAPLSMDGTVFCKSGTVLQDAKAPTGASIKTTGSLSPAANGGTASVTISLSRKPFVINGTAVATSGVFMTVANSTTITVANFDTVGHTVNYAYI